MRAIWIFLGSVFFISGITSLVFFVLAFVPRVERLLGDAAYLAWFTPFYTAPLITWAGWHYFRQGLSNANITRRQQLAGIFLAIHLGIFAIGAVVGAYTWMLALFILVFSVLFRLAGIILFLVDVLAERRLRNTRQA